MKKKLLTSIIIFIIILTFIASYYVLNHIFPKANKIQSPQIDDIISITIILNDNDKNVKVAKEEVQKLVLNINNAKPTRKQSVNDNPAIKPYYTIIFETSKKQYCYFVYEEGSQVYIEVPYEGIYGANYQMFDMIMKYYEKKYEI